MGRSSCAARAVLCGGASRACEKSNGWGGGGEVRGFGSGGGCGRGWGAEVGVEVGVEVRVW